jgi:hypothetical protein
VPSPVWIVNVYAMIFGVALMILAFWARPRYRASVSRVWPRQPGVRVRRQRPAMR